MTVLIGLAILLIASITAEADPGLDLAIVMDRSQSMSRHARLAPAMLHMSADVLTRNAAMYGVEHRIAVVSFGSSATVDLPWTSARRGTSFQIRDHQPAGGTDILAALQTAEQLFRALRPDPARRHAIVLLTDGVPHVHGTDMQRYLVELRQYVSTVTPTLDIILLTQSDTPQQALRNSFADGAHRTDGVEADVLAKAHEIITHLAGTPSVESALSKSTPGVEHIVVPPYLELIVFDVFRPTNGANVDVFPPGGGHPLREGVDGVEAMRLGDVLEALAVSRPRPGEWVVRKSRADSHVRVRSQHFFPRGALLQPDAAALAVAGDRVRIAYQVLDETERPLEELREYPLSLSVTIATPDGRKLAMPMERDHSFGRAAFRTTEDAHCAAAGRYWTDVRVTTNDAAGRRLEVFRDRWSGFTVDAARAPVEARAVPQPPRSSRLTRWGVAIAAVALFVGGMIVRLRKT